VTGLFAGIRGYSTRQWFFFLLGVAGVICMTQTEELALPSMSFRPAEQRMPDQITLSRVNETATCSAFEMRFVGVLMEIESAPLELLQDAEAVAAFVRKAGLKEQKGVYNGEDSSFQIFNKKAPKKTDGLTRNLALPGLPHIPNQLSCAISQFRKQGFHSFLEVGTSMGYNVAFITALARRFATADGAAFRAIGSDTERHLTKCMRKVLQSLGIHYEQLDDGRESRYQLRGVMHTISDGTPMQVDVCYINGDISHIGVRRDFETVKDLCRSVVFHGVADPVREGVRKIWKDIGLDRDSTAETVECVDHPDATSLRNIGLGIARLVPPSTPRLGLLN